jgi:hypothetical protein
MKNKELIISMKHDTLIMFFMFICSLSLTIILYKISLVLLFLTGLMTGYTFILFIVLLIEIILEKMVIEK